MLIELKYFIHYWLEVLPYVRSTSAKWEEG